MIDNGEDDEIPARRTLTKVKRDESGKTDRVGQVKFLSD